MTDLLSTTSTKETWVLKDTLDHIDFTDVYRTFHPNTTEYTLFKVNVELSLEYTTY